MTIIIIITIITIIIIIIIIVIIIINNNNSSEGLLTAGMVEEAEHPIPTKCPRRRWCKSSSQVRLLAITWRNCFKLTGAGERRVYLAP